MENGRYAPKYIFKGKHCMGVLLLFVALGFLDYTA